MRSECDQKRLCKNCIRWYFTKADQCEVPDCGVLDKENTIAFRNAVGISPNEAPETKFDTEGAEFLKERLDLIQPSGKGRVFGHPSKLNFDNTCHFYRPMPRLLGFLIGFARMFDV